MPYAKETKGGLKGKLKGIFSKKATSAQSYSTSGVPSPTQLPLWPVDTKGNTKQASRVPSPTLLPSSSGDTKGNIAGNPKGGTKGNTGSGTVWNGVLSVLRVAQASLDDVPVPGLKSAIGGFLEVVGQLEKAEANAEAISQLQNNIEFFNRSVSDPLKQYAAKGPVPPEVAEAVEALSTQLVATITTLQSYRHKNSASLWANRDQIERDIRVAGIKIRDGVTAFLASQAVQVHLGMKTIDLGMKTIDSGVKNINLGMKNMHKDLHDQIERLHSQTEKHGESLEREAEPYLNKLPHVLGAGYDTNRPGAPSNCFPGTRTEILNHIKQWLHRPINDTSKPVFWVNGLAGIGKSTIARTIAQYADECGLLGSSFFFVRQHAELSSAKFFLGTIVRNFARKLPEFGAAVAEALKEDENIPHASFATQCSSLLFAPLRGLELSEPLFLVIDALDECKRDDVDGVKELLRYIVPGCTGIPCLRMLMTSRPEHHITTDLNRAVNVDKIVIHEVDKHVASQDIELYFWGQFEFISQRFNDTVPDGWPSSVMVSALTKKAGRLFIWAATAVKFIEDDDALNPMYQLELLLNDSDAAGRSPYAELDKLYGTVLSACVAKTPRGMLEPLHRLLHTIVLLNDPLPLKALGAFAMVSDPKSLLIRIQSIIPLPPLPEGGIEVYHPSFPDFMLQRCKDPQLRVDVERHERWMTLRCLTLLITGLVPAVDGIVPWYSLNTDVKDLSVKLTSLVGEEVEYACRFWTFHLGKLQMVDDEVRRALEKFTGARSSSGKGLLLRWVRVMSMIGHVGDAVRSLRNALPWMRTANLLVHIAPVLHEAFRMILTYAPAIKASAAHISQSILPSLPTNSQLLEAFQQAPSPTAVVLTGRGLEWPFSIATLIGHSDLVISVIFSPDGLLLASASDDCTVRLWDPHTGSHLKTLEGHSGSVTSVAFSLDGLLLASASGDHTIRLWEPHTGSHLRTFEGHCGRVTSVAFSPDGLLLGSGSSDCTIKLWGSHTGSHLRTFEGHSGWVTSVAFSQDGLLLASASGDCTTRLWDPLTGSHLRTLKGHFDSPTFVAFSPDGLFLVSASSDRTMVIWDPHTGSNLKALEGHSDSVTSVAFSPDGSLLASASDDRTIKLWDPHTGNHIKTVEHTRWVKSVAFSPDGLILASASGGRTIGLWDPHIRSHLKALESHSDSVTSMAFSPNTLLLASASRDHVIKLWDTHTGSPLKTLAGHCHWVTSVTFSPDGLLLVSASGDHTIRLWDPHTGGHLKTLQGHSRWVTSVTFSADGLLLASASYDHTIRLWDPHTGSHLKTLEGHSHWVTSVAFSQDGLFLASASDDCTIWLWDPYTGTHLKTLEGHSDSVISEASVLRHLAFQNEVSTVFVKDGQWLCVNGSYLFSLPSNHTLSTWAFLESLVAFGFETGQVLMVDISFDLDKLGCM